MEKVVVADKAELSGLAPLRGGAGIRSDGVRGGLIPSGNWGRYRDGESEGGQTGGEPLGKQKGVEKELGWGKKTYVGLEKKK